MKKLLLVGALALFSAVNAQIGEGTMFISGNVGYNGQKDNNSKVETDKFSVVPTFGYFVAPNLAVGLGVGYNYNSSENTAALVKAKTSASAFVVEPFVRKYWNASEKFLLFGQLSVPMAFGQTKVELGNSTAKNDFTSYGVVVKPGIDYIVAPNWTIEASVGEFGYRSDKFKNAERVENYKFGVDFGAVNFGVKYLFK